MAWDLGASQHLAQSRSSSGCAADPLAAGALRLSARPQRNSCLSSLGLCPLGLGRCTEQDVPASLLTLGHQGQNPSSLLSNG